MQRKTITNSVTVSDKSASGTKIRKWLGRRRGKPPILGPRDMSMFVKKQMLMDAASWSLFWERRHEFDPFTSWQADFKTLKYRRSRMVGLEGQLSKGLKWSVYQFRP